MYYLYGRGNAPCGLVAFALARIQFTQMTQVCVLDVDVAESWLAVNHFKC